MAKAEECSDCHVQFNPEGDEYCDHKNYLQKLIDRHQRLWDLAMDMDDELIDGFDELGNKVLLHAKKVLDCMCESITAASKPKTRKKRAR